MSKHSTDAPIRVLAAAERLVDAEIAVDVGLQLLFDTKGDPDANDHARDRMKDIASERDEALIALAALFGKTWPLV